MLVLRPRIHEDSYSVEGNIQIQMTSDGRENADVVLQGMY